MEKWAAAFGNTCRPVCERTSDVVQSYPQKLGLSPVFGDSGPVSRPTTGSTGGLTRPVRSVLTLPDTN